MRREPNSWMEFCTSSDQCSRTSRGKVTRECVTCQVPHSAIAKWLWFHAELPEQKRIDVRVFLDLLCDRLSSTMAGLCFDAQQNRIRSAIRSLQARRHFLRVHGI